MSAAFIGCKISLISKSEIRYEGILYTIDTKESTIALAKVRSFGTEDRQTDKPVAPRNEVYEYIIFRASDIKDLIVDDPPSASPGLSDPAIIQAQSVGTGNSTNSFADATASAQTQKNTSTLNKVLASASNPTVTAAGSRGSSPTVPKSSGTVQDKETKRQAPIGQNRENRQVQRNERETHNNRGRQNQPQGQQRGQVRQNQPGRGGYYQNQNFGGRGRPQGRAPFQQRQPGQYGYNQRRGQNFARTPRTDVTKLEEYDFEKANQEFTELEKGITNLSVEDEAEVQSPDVENANEDPSYDKAKSFFDAISCEALEREKGNVNRVDRRQERKLNEETFGVGGIRNFRPRGYGRGGYGNYRGYGNRNYSQRGGWNNGNRRGGDQRRTNGQTDRNKPTQAVET